MPSAAALAESLPLSQTLFCYHQEGGWKPVDLQDQQFSAQYNAIRGYLDQYQGAGVRASKNFCGPIEVVSSSCHTRIMMIESHRCCTVAYCIQHNLETSGVRYLVYGTKWNLDSTYGIGTTLEAVDVEKYCPRGDIASIRMLFLCWNRGIGFFN